MAGASRKDAASGTDTPVEGRRGYVAVLFADLCDYTALNETIDPEDTDGLRHQIEVLATQVIKKHGGSVTQFYGDGILAVFGIPTPQEDDARRAIEAAIELHEATGSLEWSQTAAGFEVRLHTGVHAGLVFARDGDALHGKYELIGDTVNTAARLCSAAARAQILVSGAALRGIEAFFATEAARELQLKGKKEPVRVHCVTGRSDVRTRFEARSRRGLTGFVGRRAELSELAAKLDDAMRGQARLVVVSGPAGIGKSRLLEEFGTRAAESDVRVLRGSCESYGEMAPLEPFLQALRHLFGVKATTLVSDAATMVESQLAAWGGQAKEHLPTLLALLSLAPMAKGTEHGAAESPVERALAELVKSLSLHSALLLVLDDWQWADDASRDALERIVRETSDRPICVVVGTRVTERPDPTLARADVVRLVPFREDESALVIRLLRPRALDLGVAPAIHRQSGGNPLFLEELCRSLPDDVRGGEGILNDGGAPTTLQGVIQARVAGLPAREAQVLCAASIIGTEFTQSLLARIVPDHDLDCVLRALSFGDLIYATGLEDAFRFKHGVARDIIYESVRIAERKRIHQVIAETVERAVAGGAADQSEALAYHYRGAGDHARAADFAELAGNKAMVASALDRASFQYAAALTALDRLPSNMELLRRWVAIGTRWAAVCVYSPSRDQLATLEKAAAYARTIGDFGAEAQAEYAFGWISYVLGDYQEPIRHFRRALELAAQLPNEKFMAQLWANLGQSHAAAGEYDEALTLLTRSIENKRTRPRQGASRVVAQGFAYCLGCRASVYADIGKFDLADRDLGDALAIVRDAAHAIEGSVLALQAMTNIYRGDWRGCADAAARSKSIAQRVDSAYVFSTSSAYEAYSLFMINRAPEAIQALKRAVDWLEVREIGLFISFSYGCLAEALVTAGDAESARDYAERALNRAARHDPLGETMAHRALAVLNEADGQRGEADNSLRRAMDAATRRGSPRDQAVTRVLAAELSQARGDLALARQTAREVLPAFESRSMHWYADRARLLLDAP